jgi:hypothetical protein
LVPAVFPADLARQSPPNWDPAELGSHIERSSTDDWSSGKQTPVGRLLPPRPGLATRDLLFDFLGAQLVH